MDPTTIVSDVKTTDVLPGLTFIGGVDPDFLQDDSDFLQEIGLSAATAAVYTKSGTTIAGTATQTSLVVTGNSNNISSPAPVQRSS